VCGKWGLDDLEQRWKVPSVYPGAAAGIPEKINKLLFLLKKELRLGILPTSTRYGFLGISEVNSDSSSEG
jgi:hypothetical protein